MTLECRGNNPCSNKNCKLTMLHWHCDYCKEIQIGWWNKSRTNCNLCAGEKSAKTKLSRIRKVIKNEVSKYKDKEDSEIISILKSTRIDVKAFHNSSEDIEKIIDNYFDKSKPLPLISVNNHYPIDLNYSRKKNEFDNTNEDYLKLIKENNRKDIYINCHYNDRDDCKRLGGKWDNNKKSWYIPKEIDSTKFTKWL